MKVCIVTPPSGFLLDERVFLTLGILKVGAVLRQAGYEVEHLDFSGVANYEKAAQDYSGNAEVFAYTSTTPQLPAAVQIRRILGGRSILGGPHATLVHAAAKRNNARAMAALRGLVDEFETVVAGDGERAIFAALNSKGVVDADNPMCDLWQTSLDFEKHPWPDRSLVDVGSYHYAVDGRDALSMVGQLGCVTEDTLIVMQSGQEVPIKDLKVGDHVLCFNESTERLESHPIAQKYQRQADDIWEITWDNGHRLCLTGEHPIFAKEGWETTATIRPDTFSAYLPRVRQAVRGSVAQSKGYVVLENVPVPVAKKSSQYEVAACRSSEDARTLCINDGSGATSVFHDRSKQSSDSYTGDTGKDCGFEEGRQEPHEKTGSSTESIRHNQGKTLRVFQSTNVRQLEERSNQAVHGKAQCFSEPFRGFTAGNSPNGSPTIPVVRRWGVLDRTMQIREPQESRLYSQAITQSDIDAWRVLAPRRGGSGTGLLEQGLATADGVEQGITDKVPSCSDREASIVWSRIISKRFIGKGTVYNLTVHPGHTYFANRMLVHNCPFECAFCGGRNSAMLRRIRTRTADSVVAEMSHLYETYGVTGIMFYDDELNVNRGMVELMRKIKATGIDWRLRGFVKAELFTEEQAEAMYEAGFRWVLCGFEAAHPRILRNINKKATVEDNTRMLRTAHKYGLKVKALMSCGHPAESEETINATREWLLEEKPDDFDLTIITIFPGTPYYDNAVEVAPNVYCFETHGDRLYSDDVDFSHESAYYKGKPGEYHVFVWTDFITRERLAQLRDEVEEDVRSKLGIPYPAAAAAVAYEHSMGQRLPESILRSSK